MIFKPFALLKDDPPILKVIRSSVEVNDQKNFMKQLQLNFLAMMKLINAN